MANDHFIPVNKKEHSLFRFFLSNCLKKRFSGIVIFYLISLAPSLNAQSIFEYNGYLQNMQTVWAQKGSDYWILSGGINNRFDFYLYPSEQITVNLGLRNLMDYGQTIQLIPDYEEFVTSDAGYFKLTKKWASNKSYVFYSNIDRLNIFYSADKIEFQLGRQRVNWGLNMVWTPNDIFNSASYLNFDYVEKPGSDGARIQYYFGPASSIETVVKIDSEEKITSAIMLKLNKWDYDIQLFGGVMTDDVVLGGGWAGNISNAGFTGEFSYFKNKNKFADTTGQLAASIGTTYIFPNELNLHAEFLYNSAGKTGKAGGLTNIFTQPYSAKNLSPAKYSLFGDISYPLTPLIRIDMSSIFNPSDKSFYAGPFVDISLTDSIYLLCAGQFFFGDPETEWGDYGEFYYLRIKWNF